jgi:hypothetical protein
MKAGYAVRDASRSARVCSKILDPSRTGRTVLMRAGASVSDKRHKGDKSTFRRRPMSDRIVRPKQSPMNKLPRPPARRAISSRFLHVFTCCASNALVVSIAAA